MSLLPPNQPINDQKLVLFLTDNLECLTEYLTTLPDEANKEVLEHLAVIFDVDITGLNEDEAREYIKSAIDIHKHKGTVYAVKKAINVVFEKAELKEWFDKDLTAGLFDVEVTIAPDTKKIYSSKKFQTAIRLLNDAKNVRSHLNTFEIRLPPITAPLKVGTFSEAVKIHPYINIDEIIDLETININSGYKYDPEIKTNIDEVVTADDINLTGGYKWQVEV